MKQKPKPKTTETIGKIYPKHSLFLRNVVGTAESGKLKYDMTYLMNGQPMIESKQTGKWFTLEWGQIIDLAVKAGIDKKG